MSKKLFWSFLLLGIGLRLLFTLVMNHDYDTFRILALAKSVADTGSIGYGFFKIGSVQLYGLLFYQVIGAWMVVLSHLHLIDLRYIFDSAGYSQNNPAYLHLFPLLAPELYQMTLIKLFQFVWDIPFLLGILALAKAVQIPRRHWLVLFWAVNPIYIHTGYILMQSDIMMMAFFVWGVYATIKAIQSQRGLSNYTWGMVAMMFLAGGAVTKQFPLLLVPFALLLVTESLWGFLLNIAAFAGSYMVFYQPWTLDAGLIKEHFMLSEESMALFNFNLNGFNIFFTLYIILFLFFLIKRTHIKKHTSYVIHFVLLLITVVFVSEASGNLFVQFMIWAMPFLELLALSESAYTLFLALPFIGFLRRGFVDNSVFTGSFSFSMGAPFEHLMSYKLLLQKFGNVEILIMLLITVFVAGFSWLSYNILLDFNGKKKDALQKLSVYLRYFSVKTYLLALCGLTVLIGGTLAYLEHQHLLLTDYNYFQDATNLSDKNLSLLSPTKPYQVIIHNPHNFSITGVYVVLQRHSVVQPEHLMVKAYDVHTGKLLASGALDDFILTEKPDFTYIIFNHGTNASDIRLAFQNSGPRDDVLIGVSDQENANPDSAMPRNDSFYGKQQITIETTTPLQYPMMQVVGEYRLSEMLTNFMWQLNKKPSFEKGYLGLIGIVLTGSIALYLLGKKSDTK